MTPKNQHLLELIIKNYSTNAICNELKITKTQLKARLNSLKQEGYNIQRRFFYEGMQKYALVKDTKKDYIEINNVPKNFFKALVIADTHIGSKYENIDYIQMAYEYCIENGINIIIHGGDLIQGTLGPRKFKSLEHQIEYLLDVYPYDPQIINFIELGNHDKDLVKSIGIDLHRVLNQNREDLVSLGYGLNRLKVKDDFISLIHSANDIRDKNQKLTITGHGHRFQFKANGNAVLYAPTLSDEIKDGYPPGMVEINLLIHDNQFEKGIFRHLLVTNKVTPASNIVWNFENQEPKTYIKH